jgi:uncharacterized membrane protein
MSANLRKDPITTIAGAVLLVLGLYIVFDSYQEDGFKTWKDFLLPLGSIVTGVILVRSPDTIIRWGNKAVDKKLGKDKGDNS